MILIGEIAIALLGLSGFILANYIRDTKKTDAHLICPLEGNCEAVIHSDYSKFIGIPVELIGIQYYGLITLSYFLYVIYPDIMPDTFSYFILALSTIAFLFSIYLTAVQSLLIKHWCTWCLISAGICTLIFIFATFISNEVILELIQNI